MFEKADDSYNSIQRLTQESEKLLAQATTAKETLFTCANSEEEAEEVLTFTKNLIDRRLEYLQKNKDAKF